MIKAIIIDDEQNNIDNLQGLLHQYCPEVDIVATARSAGQGVAQITAHQPQLIFLDIQMPGTSGLEMLASIVSADFEIIFVTAFDQYAIQAIKFSAIDYLLKPIEVNELKLAVEKAVLRHKERTQNMQLENLISLLKHTESKEEHRIALPAVKETRYVKASEIVRCESSNSYTTFHLTNKEKITVSRPILEYEELLKDYQFIRCHQCHLVNKKFITSWIKIEGDSLRLEDGTSIPISRQRKDFVRAQLTVK